MRRAAILAGLLLAAACRRGSAGFRLSGRVELAPALAADAPRKGAVLFVVAENAGGVPFAIHRVVNPDFPVSFEMGPDDLIVPAPAAGQPLQLHAELNGRGDVGHPRAGDLLGRAASPARPGDSGLLIVLDRRR